MNYSLVSAGVGIRLHADAINAWRYETMNDGGFQVTMEMNL